jgi:acetyltransferase-like isoleucine patch superfamily enzyme
MNPPASRQTLPNDWYSGTIPLNVRFGEGTYLATSYTFHDYRSRAGDGLRVGRGASLDKTVLDVGVHGRVSLGEFAFVSSARIICDAEVDIGDYALIGWNVVIMDTYRVPLESALRRQQLERSSLGPERYLESPETAHPVRIGRNVWIGFEACILPGVTIGEGAVIGARAVVVGHVAPFTVVAGNPARLVRVLDRDK